ncbi:MAG: DUF3048 domain-containing protein [bacterium]|nr:DUF3048 domain-containing protein [bacterium]
MEEQEKQAENLVQGAFEKNSENSDLNAINPNKAIEENSKTVKNPFKKLKNKWKKLSKRGKIITVVVAILVLAGIFAGIYFLTKGNDGAEVVEQQPESTTVASVVTGAQVQPKINEQHTTGVMIENSPDARPQSGLQQADIVYEAIAEGGITRFLVLYHDEQTEKIGPIRSARPYYLDWIRPWDASYAHVGGSPEALKKIKSLGIQDLDQFFNSGSYYKADDRFAPHNVYSSTESLDKLEKDKGYKKSEGTGFSRAETDATVGDITAQTISMNISSANYNSAWTFQKGSNTYKRDMAGSKHVDAKTAKQLEYKVVIALVMDKGIDSDGQHTTYDSIGNGTAFIYQSGTVIKGTWTKASEKDQFKFTNAAGETITLNPGKTWITIADSASQISHKAAPKPKVETTN